MNGYDQQLALTIVHYYLVLTATGAAGEDSSTRLEDFELGRNDRTTRPTLGAAFERRDEIVTLINPSIAAPFP